MFSLISVLWIVPSLCVLLQWSWWSTNWRQHYIISKKKYFFAFFTHRLLPIIPCRTFLFIQHSHARPMCPVCAGIVVRYSIYHSVVVLAVVVLAGHGRITSHNSTQQSPLIQYSLTCARCSLFKLLWWRSSQVNDLVCKDLAFILTCGSGTTFVGHTHTHSRFQCEWWDQLCYGMSCKRFFFSLKVFPPPILQRNSLVLDFFSTTRVRFSWMNSCVEIDFSWSCCHYTAVLLLLAKTMMMGRSEIPMLSQRANLYYMRTNGMRSYEVVRL